MSVILMVMVEAVSAAAPEPAMCMSPTLAAPGLEKVWHSLEPMVREARDTGQTELEVR